MASISVWLDTNDQIICQRITGRLSPEEFRQLTELTARYAAQLDDPGNIRILVDAREMQTADVVTRRLGVMAFEEKNIRRMAVWGAAPLERTAYKMAAAVIGRDRLATFATEVEARAWLTEKHPESPGAP